VTELAGVLFFVSPSTMMTVMGVNPGDSRVFFSCSADGPLSLPPPVGSGRPLEAPAGTRSSEVIAVRRLG
jgi:hypothetical protein